MRVCSGASSSITALQRLQSITTGSFPVARFDFSLMQFAEFGNRPRPAGSRCELGDYIAAKEPAATARILAGKLQVSDVDSRCSCRPATGPLLSFATEGSSLLMDSYGCSNAAP